MDTNNLPPEFAMLEELAKEAQKQVELAAKILEQQPDLGIATAYIIAGDRTHADRIDKMFQEGKLKFKQAAAAIGSYARFDWVVKQLDAKKVTAKTVYKMLPHLWTASDPDDTNPRYLELWKAAHKANHNLAILDGKKLPERMTFRIYRGQDRTQQTVGFAWSLDQATAAKFARGAWARQGNRDGVVIVGEVRRPHILAYLTDRGEQEIIVDPQHVKEIERI
jgi:hypothetical protein